MGSNMIKLPPISTIADPLSNRTFKNTHSPVGSAVPPSTHTALPSPADITPPSSIMKNSISSPRGGMHKPQRSDNSASSTSALSSAAKSSNSASYRPLSERSFNRSPISSTHMSNKSQQTSLPPISIKNLRSAQQHRTPVASTIPTVLPSLLSPKPQVPSPIDASTSSHFANPVSYHQQLPPYPSTPQLANPGIQQQQQLPSVHQHPSMVAPSSSHVMQQPPMPHSVPPPMAPHIPNGSYYPYPQYYHTAAQVRNTAPKLYRSPHDYSAGAHSSKKINGYKLRCECCMSDSTPEWRRGPNGARTLCNACGLYYAKVSKKKGPEVAAQEIQKKKHYKESQKFLQDNSQYQPQQLVHGSLQPVATPEMPMAPVHHSHQSQQHQMPSTQQQLAPHPPHQHIQQQQQQQHMPVHYGAPQHQQPLQQQQPQPGYRSLPQHQGPPHHAIAGSPDHAKHEQLPSIHQFPMANAGSVASPPPPHTLQKGGVLPPLAQGGYQYHQHPPQPPPPPHMVYQTDYSYQRYE